jgi:hypothetical protein
MYKMKRTKNSLKITAILCVFFFLLSCNPLEDESQSHSMLLVLSMTGTTIDGDDVSFHQSDVVIEGAVHADTASVTLQAKLLNPQPLVPQASQYTSIVVTRYVISYSRSDGQNTPGVDVPYSFEGSLSTLIEIDATVDIPIVIVREVAKLEPPLLDLRGGGDEIVLQVTATIDFYGHDLVNNAVKATGYLTIFFGDYIDP